MGLIGGAAGALVCIEIRILRRGELYTWDSLYNLWEAFFFLKIVTEYWIVKQSKRALFEQKS